jgi:hypothetical protein
MDNPVCLLYACSGVKALQMHLTIVPWAIFVSYRDVSPISKKSNLILITSFKLAEKAGTAPLGDVEARDDESQSATSPSDLRSASAPWSSDTN